MWSMEDRYRWWLHPFNVRNSNMQDCRIRYKKKYHDSLMSDYKLEKMNW